MLARNAHELYASIMKDLSINKLLQDFSAIIGSLLPIAQLFLGQWVFAFDKVFLAKDQFLGVSIITVIVGYIFIIAYLSNPFGELVLLGQKKKQLTVQRYWNEKNRLENYLQFLNTFPNPQPSAVKKTLSALLDLVQPKPPLVINQQNQGKVIVSVVIISAIIFLSLGISHYSSPFTNILQAVSYVLLVTASALMLTIYKKNSDNNSYYRENRRTRVDKAIKLAIDANGFGNLPQVTFISQEDVGQFNGSLRVRASYENKVFEIETDSEAQFLISVKDVTNLEAQQTT
jgi:hypothetical protein